MTFFIVLISISARLAKTHTVTEDCGRSCVAEPNLQLRACGVQWVLRPRGLLSREPTVRFELIG